MKRELIILRGRIKPTIQVPGEFTMRRIQIK